ncbi:MAG: hypothetical protein B6243_11565 [Anaerolineaceae bacterium 4572_5.2]|nr:MAG: hypothetical protein B6243_11565 [Anaerolineaceae bacterium 4572_5.2]
MTKQELKDLAEALTEAGHAVGDVPEDLREEMIEAGCDVPLAAELFNMAEYIEEILRKTHG